LLLDINIINFKRIIVDVNRQKLIIKSYRNLKIKLKIILKNNIRIKQIVKIERSLVIVVYFVLEILVVVQDKILLNKNYLFELILFNAYSYVANKKMSFVCICNDCLISLYILQHATLKRLLEFKKQDYYTKRAKQLKKILRLTLLIIIVKQI